MRHRTLTLLATPAVLGAMTVAVPALAGVEDGPAAHSSSSKCFVARIAKHRVRECLVQGPRGHADFRDRPAHADTPEKQARRGPWENRRYRQNRGPDQAQRGPREALAPRERMPLYNRLRPPKPI